MRKRWRACALRGRFILVELDAVISHTLIKLFFCQHVCLELLQELETFKAKVLSAECLGLLL